MHLFLMPAYLRDKASHPYSETLGWRRWCETRGIGLQVFAHHLAEPDVLANTGAVPAFGVTEEDEARLALPPNQLDHERDPMSWRLDRFMRGTWAALRGCRIAWASRSAQPDAIVFPWGFASQMNGAAEWLSELAPQERPAMAFNIVRAEVDWEADAERRNVSGDFSFLRFAARRLRTLLAPERLVIAAVDPRLRRTLAMVCEMPVHEVAPHVTYPTEAEFAAWRPRARPAHVTIGMMGVNRGEKAGPLAPAVIAAISRARPQTRFFLQVADQEAAAYVAVALQGCAVNLAIQVGGLGHEDYWRRLLANDLLLMPYSGRDYALTPSGPFCEGLASAVPAVVPRHTWMGDRLADGSGAGETFDTLEVEAVAAAAVRAIDRLPALRAQAAARAPAWWAGKSLDAHIAGVLSLLGLDAASPP